MIWMEDYREFLREQQIFMWGFWSTMLAFPIPMRASSMSLMKNSPRTCSVWTLKSQHVWSNSFFHPCWNTNEEPLSMLVLVLAVCCPQILSTPSMLQQKRMSIIHPLSWNINQELLSYGLQTHTSTERRFHIEVVIYMYMCWLLVVVLDSSNIVCALLCDGVFMLFYVNRFVDQLSRSLYVEYKHSGIDVQCQVLFSLLFFSVLLYLILFFLQYQVPNIAYLGCNGSSFSLFVVVGFFLPNLPAFLENSFESLNPEWTLGATSP